MPRPESAAGLRASNVLTLNIPEMFVPEFSQPDTRPPAFPKPDPPPTPAWKNPDDGKVVELPMPGTARISMIEMSMAVPVVVRRSKSSGIPEIVIPGMVIPGMSRDRSMGKNSAMEIPPIIEAGISTAGISSGMESAIEIAGIMIDFILRSRGILKLMSPVVMLVCGMPIANLKPVRSGSGKG